MKKLTAILLALVLLLGLTGCEDAISKLLYQSGKDDPDAVQAQEPDIPGTTPPGGDAAPEEPTESGVPDDAVEPAEPQPGTEEPSSGEEGEKEDGKKPDGGVAASHSDVSLFSAGETFTLSARGVSGIYAGSYVSADPEIASVDELTGEVTAVSPGTTTVTMHVECEAGQFDFDCIVRCRWEAEDPGLPGAGTEETPETPAGPDAPASAQPSLSGFFSTLQGEYEGLTGMMAMDAQMLDNYYPGLSGIAAVEEVLVYESAISINNMAVGLVKLSDSATTEDILAVQSILQSRITAQAEGGAWYPASCETWENGVITSASNCVGMFVYPDDAHSMANLFTDTFSS